MCLFNIFKIYPFLEYEKRKILFSSLPLLLGLFLPLITTQAHRYTVSRYCPLMTFSFELPLTDTRSFLQSIWDRHQIHLHLGPMSLLAHRLVFIPFWGTARRLAHRPVSGSNTICNNPDPLLADIVLFELSLSGFPQGSKTRLLGEDFHTLINGSLFSSPTNVGHHNPPPPGPNVLIGTLSFLQSMWDRPQIHPPFGPSVLTGTPPRVYSLSGNNEKAGIVQCLTLIPFVTTQTHR